MSFKNFLDLRKKTQQQTQVIELVVFQKRSLKSDFFLALSVIFVASFVVWGIGMADYSPQTDADLTQTNADGMQNTNTETMAIPNVANVIEALLQTSDSSVIPVPVFTSINSDEIQSDNPDSSSTQIDTNTNLDPRIREDDNAGENENAIPSVIPAEAGIQSGNTNTENTDLGHEYFSAEKSLDPDSTRQSPSLNLDPTPSSTPSLREDDNAGTSSSSTTPTQTNLDGEYLIGQATSELPLVLAPSEETSSSTTITSSTTSTAFTPLLFADIADVVKEAVSEITDIVTATSTYTSSTTVPVITSEDTDTGKLVTISAENENPFFPLTNVVASTTIPKLYKVGEESKIKIKWKNENNQEMSFQARDTDNDNYLDYVEWTVPHLSTQIFEIIFISKAFLLDVDKNIISDIYDEVRKKDGNYFSVYNDQYIRTTFGQFLDETNDITVYARPTNVKNSSSIEVYPVYTDENGNQTQGNKLDLVNDGINADFSNINRNAKYRILLSNLQTPTDVFDLKIIGSSIDFDYIVDPTTSINISTGADTCLGCWDAGSPTNTYTATGADVINATTLATNLASGNVVLTGVSNDITVSNAVTKASGGDTTLTMYAGENIIVNADVISSSNKFNLLLNSDRDANSSGYINIAGALTSNGGDITMGGGSGVISAGVGFAVGNAGQVTGIYVNNKTVSAGGGNIIANGQGYSTTTNSNHGVRVYNSSGSINTTGLGTINITGNGGGNTNSATNYGVSLDTGGVISTANGNVTVTGTGGGAGSGNSNTGVYIFSGNSAIKTTGSGNIFVTGTGGDLSGSGVNNYGVSVSTINGIQASGTGAISVTGNGGGSSGGGNVGLGCGAANCIQPNSTGSLTIIGTAGNAGDFNYGINLSTVGSSIIGSGAEMNITGTGGNSSGRTNLGVVVSGAGSIISNSGTGTLNITGNGGGAGSGATNHGVYVAAAGVISTVDGDLSATGIGGGAGTGASNHGVYVADANSEIKTTGLGNLSITGTGGNLGGTGGGNIGVYVYNAGSIYTGVGNLTLIGTGGGAGSGTSNHGVSVNTAGSSIKTNSGGNLSITGFGGGTNGSGSDNYGVVVSTGTYISGSGSTMTVDGTGGDSSANSNFGIVVNGASAVISNSGTGTLSITGEGGGITNSARDHGVYVLSAGNIFTEDGNLSVVGTGGGAGSGTSNHGAYVSSANSTIKTTGLGNLSVTGTGGNISGSGGTNHGVASNIANGIQATGSGTISITGNGGNSSGTGASNHGVYCGAATCIQPNATGSLTINGTGGAGSGGTNYGVYVTTGCSIAGAGATMTITGTGGNSSGSSNLGVFVIGAGAVISNIGSGTLSITGNGSGNTNSATDYGVLVSAGYISTVDGTLTVVGTGGGAGSGTSNIGVYANGDIKSTGTGNVSVTGYGGNLTGTGGNNYGTYIYRSSGLAVISTVDGTLTVVGTGGGAGSGINNYGVNITGVSTIKTTGLGNLSVTGIRGGGSTASNYGLNVAVANGLQTTSAGSVTVLADTVLLAQANDINSVANLIIRPYTAGNTVGVGSGAGTLALSDTFLGYLAFGAGSTLTIGGTTTGNIAINSASAVLQNKNVTFITAPASTITLTSMLANTSAGTITIQGGASSLNNANSFYNLAIDTTGNTATLGSALTVAGNLTISAGTLDVSATGCSSASCAVSVGGNWANFGTFTPRTGTVTLTGTGAGGTITSGSSSFYNLTQNGSGGTYTLQDPLSTTNNLTITAGTLDTKSGGNYNVTVGGTWSRSGMFVPQWSTLTLTGTSTFSDSMTFYNLTINGSGKTVTLGSALNLNRDLTITAGTLDVSVAGCAGASCEISLGGNFTNSGTFTPRTGTFSVNGTNQLIIGTTAFNILSGSGNIFEISSTVSVATSNTTITTNNGSITTNNGTVTTNGSAGTIGTNNSNINTNNGAVTINASAGTIGVNNSNITTNNGTVTTNASLGTVGTNNLNITTNNGTVTTNASLGTVGTNNLTVTTNNGTVTTNASLGTVSTNNLTVTVNNGLVITNSSLGTIGNNSGTISNANAGIITTNNSSFATNDGIVGTNTAGNTITTNNGTVLLNNGAVSTNASLGTVETNNQSIETNNGVIEENDVLGIVGINNLTILVNNGDITSNASLGIIDINNLTVTTNGGTINTNSATGVVDTNNLTVIANNGTVTENASTGTIGTNNLAVTTNDGTINTNSATGVVDTNNLTVTANNGIVTENALTGTIGTNNLVITTNNGTTTTNAFGSTITNNFGTIKLNNGTANTNIFASGEYNGPTGVITGDATFSYLTATSGEVIDITGYANGVVGGITKDSLGEPITDWIFNTTDNNGKVTGNAIFNATTSNKGTVDGNVIFNSSSTNLGIIMHNVDVYSPVARPLGGTVYGLMTYHGYPAMYFSALDGDWSNPLNWWFDLLFSSPANDIPSTSDDVYIYSDVTTASTSALARSIYFENSVTNGISIGVVGEAIFRSLSTNLVGGTITGTTTFMGNYTSNLGTVNGTLMRLFNIATSTQRKFAGAEAEGGRDNWIIIAQGVIVDISNAIYNTATNIFRALNGGSFSPTNSSINGGASVTPVIISALPTQNEIIIKWLPVIDWDDSVICEYSYDNWTTTKTADCSLDGVDIERPIAGENIISLRGTDSSSNITEQNITFTYDNTVPIYTNCGSDIIDEVTRPYYYLANDVAEDCHFEIDVELRGAYATGSTAFTVNGNIISDATSTDAFDITLKNIVVTGTTTATTTAEGKNGGNITVENSITGGLVSNGTEGTVGGNAGSITVATSSTGVIYAYGGVGITAGASGGTITVWNSDGILASTLVASFGGDVIGNCGEVGIGGDINITNSNNYVAESVDGTGMCNSESIGGTRHITVVTTRPVVTPTPTVNTNTTPTNSGSRSFVPNTINSVTLPVQMIKPITFKALPKFGDDTKGSFSFKVPLQVFLFSIFNTSIINNLKTYPKLQNFIKDTLGYSTDQKFVALYNKPLNLDANTGDVPGIFKVTSPKRDALVTTLNIDKKGNLSQHIKVNVKDDYQTLNISLAVISKTAISGKINDTKYTFTNNKTNITTTINIPQKAGTYIFTTSASPLPLVIEVAGTKNTQTPAVETKVSWWRKVLNFFGM
jgi:hypothetical protein